MRLVLDDGSQHGVVSLADALIIAREKGLDLLELSAMAKPPVCRIVEYSKYRFEKTKRDKEMRKKQRQSQVDIKELKYRPKIEEHDYQVKLKHLRRFLEDGDKVKLVIRYKGREIIFQNHGLELLARIVKDVDDIATPEKKPELLGRQHNIVVTPRQTIENKRSKGDGGETTKSKDA
ncbi:translation initiation factor IF-3 [Deferribacterales bacterium RsTz2092]|nr:translation initiation factor IF-3 [Deferribacterales bacterium]